MKNRKTPGFERNLGKILRGILQSGLSILIVGIVLVSIPAFTKILSSWGEQKEGVQREGEQKEKGKFLSQSLEGLCINLGIGFISAGLVTLLVEPRSREQLHDQVSERINALEDAAKDSIIRSLVLDENIFKEIQSHLIRQDYIIRNYEIKLSLHWNESQTKVIEKANISYEIHNKAFSDKRYPINFAISNEGENEEEEEPRILIYSVDGEDKKERISRKQDETDAGLIRITDEIDVRKNSSRKIEMTYQVFRRPDYEEPWIVRRMADGLTMTVTHHPPNLAINCTPLHPVLHSNDADGQGLFEVPSNGRREVCDFTWKIKTGILPYQGLLLSWQQSKEQN